MNSYRLLQTGTFILLLLLLLIHIPGNAYAKDFYVSYTLSDDSDYDLSDNECNICEEGGECCTNWSTQSACCTFRAAIEQANATAGEDTIYVNTSYTIELESELPAITSPVNIYADKYADNPTLDGTNAGSNADGLKIYANTTIINDGDYNFNIKNFHGNGILVDNTDAVLKLDSVSINSNGENGIYVRNGKIDKESSFSITSNGGHGIWQETDEMLELGYYPISISNNGGSGIWAGREDLTSRVPVRIVSGLNFSDDDLHGISYNQGWGIYATGCLDGGTFESSDVNCTSVELDKVSIRGNGNWGIESEKNITITNSQIMENGQNEEAGGILSQEGAITGLSIRVDYNGGPGIHSVKSDISLADVVIEYNKGDGVLTGENGNVAFDADPNLLYSKTLDTNRSSQRLSYITRNDGRGIKGNSVSIHEPIFISGNGSWGIEAGSEGLIMGYLDDTATTAFEQYSKVDSNGDGELCYEWNGFLEPLDCTGGGIFSEGGVQAANTYITDNGGPGIFAYGTIDLLRIVIQSNKGDGVRVGTGDGSGRDGSVLIDSDTEYSEINYNQGNGIKVDGCAVKWANDYWYDGCVSVAIHAPINITENGGWGIDASDGVYMGVESVVTYDADVVPLTELSTISGNGKGFDCYKVDSDGNIDETVCTGGGIFAGREEDGEELDNVKIYNTLIENNGGAGIVVEEAIAELAMIKIAENEGPGIQSGSSKGGGGVHIVPNDGYDGYRDDFIVDNKGSGILAKSCVNKNISGGSGCISVAVRNSTQIDSNGGWGIEAEGDVFMLASPEQRSRVVKNGWGDECYEYHSLDGVTFPVDCIGGGVYSKRNIKIKSAYFCDHQQEDILAEGETITEDVMYCQ